jgi:hypothetical protein
MKPSRRYTLIAIGALAGAALGGAAFWAYVKVKEQRLAAGGPQGTELKLATDPAAYFAIAMALFTLVRQIGHLLEPVKATPPPQIES